MVRPYPPVVGRVFEGGVVLGLPHRLDWLPRVGVSCCPRARLQAWCVMRRLVGSSRELGLLAQCLMWSTLGALGALGSVAW